MLASLLTLVLAAAGVARAGEDDWAREKERPGPQAELFLSALFASGVTEGSFGLRGSTFLRPRFALEGSLSRFTDDDVNIWLLDVSAKVYLKNRGRARVFLMAGPGLLAFHSDDEDASDPTLHLGFGAEFGRGKFYFRPEVRYRFLAEGVDANFGDLAFGFGWRF
jgi:hypothetical protein